LAYLPETLPSAVGQRLLQEAFPKSYAGSELVIVVARRDAPLSEEDIFVAYDIARRMKLLHAISALQRFLQSRERNLPPEAQSDDAQQQLQGLRAEVDDALAQAVYFDEAIYQWQRSEKRPVAAAVMPYLYTLRAAWYDHLGQSEQARWDRQRAQAIDPSYQPAQPEDVLRDVTAQPWPLRDVWTWRDPTLGTKLVSEDRQARLIVLRLASEFMAVRNQQLLKRVAEELDSVRNTLTDEQRQNLLIEWTGSAAIGGEVLEAARQSVAHTEAFTIVLLLGILVVVYRAPLLVVVPLASIGLSVVAAMDAVALMAVPADQAWQSASWGLRVFTTTRIFIVVILFGSGTDYCLFLIARYREELARWPTRRDSMAAALEGAGSALLASALTTIVGLAMMGFADFGKFRHSGPVIGFCLCVTLAVCLTLAPAILYALGPITFWPWSAQVAVSGGLARRSMSAWQAVAQSVSRRPGRFLVGSFLVLVPISLYGWRCVDRVTYDLLSDLPAAASSVRGTKAMKEHFPVGESGPLTVIVHKPQGDFSSSQGRQTIHQLATQLYSVTGVARVRSLVDPLGEYPPGQTIGLTDRRAWRTWLMRPHQKTEQLFISDAPRFPKNVTRMEVIFDAPPFSPDALDSYRRLAAQIDQWTKSSGSVWWGCHVAYVGPAAGMADLRAVTLKDRHRIEWLVVLAVLGVLLVILKRPVACLFLMVSVLVTYLATLGVTHIVFSWVYGPDFHGLDWKLPLFLFVILVAVGQDYNVYLVTRVWEEQSRLGPLSGLRYALVRTGGIITSCGIIMAATFTAMTSAAWKPILESWLLWPHQEATAGGLREIVQLGFALSLGILVDTMFVRTIVVPAFLAWQAHRKGRPPALSSILLKKWAFGRLPFLNAASNSET